MEFFTDTLINISGLDVEKKVSDDLYRPIDIMYQNGDASNLIEITDWKPNIAIEETLSDLLDYWNKKIN